MDTNSVGEVQQLQSYFPFGESVSASRSTFYASPFTYTGQELDRASELYYYGARYYDSTLARFAAPDPVLSEPPYAYVRNNPVQLTDPNGTDPTNDHQALVNAVRFAAREEAAGVEGAGERLVAARQALEDALNPSRTVRGVAPEPIGGSPSVPARGSDLLDIIYARVDYLTGANGVLRRGSEEHFDLISDIMRNRRGALVKIETIYDLARTLEREGASIGPERAQWFRENINRLMRTGVNEFENSPPPRLSPWGGGGGTTIRHVAYEGTEDLLRPSRLGFVKGGLLVSFLALALSIPSMADAGTPEEFALIAIDSVAPVPLPRPSWFDHNVEQIRTEPSYTSFSRPHGAACCR